MLQAKSINVEDAANELIDMLCPAKSDEELTDSEVDEDADVFEENQGSEGENGRKEGFCAKKSYTLSKPLQHVMFTQTV